MDYDAAKNSAGCYDVAINALRERLEKSRVVIGDCTLYCEKAEFIIPTLAKVDALVTDPPYGIGESRANPRPRGKTVGTALKGIKRVLVRSWEPQDWDDAPVSKELMDLIRSKAKYQIIFGGNFYELPPTSCWLVWDKLQSAAFADCELAWTNLPKAVRRLQYMWNGMLRANNEPRGDHPTQKPLGVMKWCIEQLPEEVDTILDPFMGSGTTLVSCAKMGKRGIGIEKEKKYFDVACRRVEEAYNQPDLFVARPSAALQETLL